MPTPSHHNSPLWAITAYFNPLHWRRRWENYRVFRERLGVPLAAVELAYDGRFELAPGDAEILLQFPGRDILWQKERLLNLALAALPPDCRYVVWIDCDLVFGRPDWAGQVAKHLEQVPLVQPFSAVLNLGPSASLSAAEKPVPESIRPSVAHLIAQGKSPADGVGTYPGRLPGVRATGHVWAARRDLLRRHGIYDACIVGGGDAALAAASYGVPQEVVRYEVMNASQESHYRAWAEPFYADVQGQVGCVEGDLLHLWHGDLCDRKSPQRYHDMRPFGFDPHSDIALDEHGCWRWNSDKPALHAFLRGYFASRQEDGPASASDPDQPPALPVAPLRMAA